MSLFTAERHNRLAIILALGTMVIALTGCGQAEAQETPKPTRTPLSHAEEIPTVPGSVSFDEVPAFYREAVTDFPQPLPGGVSWPSAPPGFSDGDAEGEFEAAGLGDAIAAVYWQCAWTEEFLDAFENNEQARQAEALAMLEKRVADPFFTAIFIDPQKGWKSDVLDPAKRGEVSKMKSQHRSCPSAADGGAAVPDTIEIPGEFSEVVDSGVPVMVSVDPETGKVVTLESKN